MGTFNGLHCLAVKPQPSDFCTIIGVGKQCLWPSVGLEEVDNLVAFNITVALLFVINENPFG
jgi:hypothetical protein